MVSAQRLEGFLRRHPRVRLDSNLPIYLIEEHPAYHRLAERILRSIEAGRNIGICSTLSLLEVLVQPYRENNDELVNQFYALLTTYPRLQWIELSIGIADLGAQLRAKYQLKTPDAILAATSIEACGTGFIGNDSQLKPISELDILVLSDS